MNGPRRRRQWVSWLVASGVALVGASGWAAAVQGPLIQQTPQSLCITVHLGFAPRTYALPSEALRVLDQVGRLLKDDLLHREVFAIVGHANESEDVESNQWLATRRALAVQHYLVAHHQIAAARLPVVARGAGAPLDRANPHAGVNRRVEFLRQYEGTATR